MKLEAMLGRKIQQIRKSLGLSQEALANKSDLHPTYIGRIERGEVSPTINVLNKIANSLGLPLDNLLSFEKEKESIPDFFETITLSQKASPKYLDLIKRVLKEIIRWEKENR
ncbi:MAG: helix-turn-helix transcriptional regulator [bacterium]